MGDDSALDGRVMQRPGDHGRREIEESEAWEDGDAQARGDEAESGVVVVEASRVARHESGGLTGCGDDLPRRAVVDVVVDPRFVLQLAQRDRRLRGERVGEGEDREEVVHRELMPVVSLEESGRGVDLLVPDVDVWRSTTAAVVWLVETVPAS